VAQIGYVMIGLALGTPLGMAAAALHMISHALLKSALFMGVGNVVAQTGLHSLDEGGNLARRMPFTALLTILAALGLSGMPLLSAFISKTMLEEAVIEAGWGWLSAILIAGSVFTFGGLARLCWALFAPRRATERERTLERLDQRTLPYQATRESHLMTLLPIAVLVIGSFLVGLTPAWIAEQTAIPASQALADRGGYITAVMGGEAPTAEEVHEEAIHTASPFDFKHYWVPALTLILGGGLAWAMLHQERWWAIRPLRPIHALLIALRRWHTGIVGDYALWNAFGTAVLLIAVLLWMRGA
jgi:NADH:ubiquinone oxidoreductase subunit 5 (subunit L)/multisubunit Na+/H+ antiporter MnhA subunit